MYCSIKTKVLKGLVPALIPIFLFSVLDFMVCYVGCRLEPNFNMLRFSLRAERIFPKNPAILIL